MLTRFGAIARADREIFIAKMKRGSGAIHSFGCGVRLLPANPETMSLPSPSRVAGWTLIACAAFSACRAQSNHDAPSGDADELIPLEQLVVSATRSAQDLRRTPSSVSVVDLGELERTQVDTLRSVLSEQPGVAIVSTGAPGAAAAVFIRGASTHQTLFVVDGVRMNDRSALYNPFLGSADLSNIGRLEILRGPQSTLFGSSAMGGVILIESVRGSGALKGSLNATAGSFATYGASAAASGSAGPLSYSAAAGHFQTDNERPHNGLDQWTYATRLEYAPGRRFLVGTTFRAQNAEYEEAGSRVYPGTGDTKADNYLATIYGEARLTENLRSRLTLGLHRRTYEFADEWSLSHSANRRRIIDWQNTWEAGPQLEVVAGANFEWSRFLVETAESRDQVAAGYVSTTARPLRDLTVTAGIRRDDFRSAGGATTWRAGASWQSAIGAKFRATYGTGFSAPGSDDRYGVPQYGQLPSPGLKPEKSRGWDIGVDQSLLEGRLTLSGTYFENRFRNLFEYEYVDPATFSGRIVNRTRASTSGLEFGGKAGLGTRADLRLTYTYLEARNDESGSRLIRRPRHMVDGQLTFDATDRWLVGVGAHVVAGRVEGGGAIEDYATARVFTTFAVRPELLLKLRIENAFDEQYEEVFGYPALSRGIFGSVEWRF